MFLNNKNKDPKICKEFEQFLANSPRIKSTEQIQLVRKAFDYAYNAHKDMLRYSGEAYIIHSLEVAKIVTQKIGLGSKSATVAFLHDVPEKTEYDTEDIRRYFGDQIADLLISLQKIKKTEYFDNNSQASLFRQILLAISDDIRVIYVKIADRLHNIRTLNFLPPERQTRYVEETMNIYAPLSHRLGLYDIKSEMEDLCFKFTHPKIYHEISEKIVTSEQERMQLIKHFEQPLRKRLESVAISYRIKSRIKSIFSIWKKMEAKKINFEEIYDIFAIRVIFSPSLEVGEKIEALYISSLITEIYTEKEERTRNWLDHPKDTGYRALHLTVMSKEGKWVEVQIRSESMDEAAEYGLAAHWKYKGLSDKKTELDSRIHKILEELSENNDDGVDFLDNLQLSLFTSEIYVFTPKGEIITLPKGSTVLDFAFEIHTELAFKAIAAKINGKTVSLNSPLSSGDQVLIITSENQKPLVQWLDWVISPKAVHEIKEFVKKEQNPVIQKGKDYINQILQNLKVPAIHEALTQLMNHYELPNKESLFQNIGNGKISETEILHLAKKKFEAQKKTYWDVKLPVLSKKHKHDKKNEKLFESTTFEIADCCKPTPDDKVRAVKSEKGNDLQVITIHRSDCKQLKILQENHRIFEVEWHSYEAPAFLVGIEISGQDKMGITNKITSVISNDLSVNIKSIKLDTNEGKFYCTLEIYVRNRNHLKKIVKSLKNISEIQKVSGIDV